MHDLVIRSGTLVDGSGAPARLADVAIDGDQISAVGSGNDVGPGRRTIDADGLVMTPGVVDVHTHYDGQATWDSQLLPSAWHGVTTVVMGNCGVGFAPVRPHDHERLVELMEGVEDIPGTALHEGLQWDWESFPDYLDALDRRPHDVDLAAQVPHAALRLYVMGERGAAREAATPEEITEMGQLARQAVDAGALGFTTSRTRNHRTSRGDFTPTLTAAAAELHGIAQALGDSHAGALQVVSDFTDIDPELTTIIGMAEISGRPLSISVSTGGRRGEQWRRLLDAITDANRRGVRVTAQVPVRAIGVIMGLDATISPIGGSAIARGLGHDAEALRREAVRSAVVAELAGRPPLFPWEQVFPVDEPIDYEPPPDASVAARARRLGVTPEALVVNLLAADGERLFYVPFLNYADGNLDAAREMLAHRYAVAGLSDGGAHVGTICDASFPTTMLTLWVRDRVRGERLPIEHAVSMQTSRTARMVGLEDRGVIAPGFRADFNLIDFDELALESPAIAFDLPAGGRRFLQRARGYRHTFVAGQETYVDGEHTGALPGRLVRGTRAASGAA